MGHLAGDVDLEAAVDDIERRLSAQPDDRVRDLLGGVLGDVPESHLRTLRQLVEDLPTWRVEQIRDELLREGDRIGKPVAYATQIARRLVSLDSGKTPCTHERCAGGPCRYGGGGAGE